MIVALLLTVSLLGCTTTENPPIGSQHRDGIENYGKYNRYTALRMQERFLPLLPEQLPQESTALRYFYDYWCALVGDPCFGICLELRFDSSEGFEGEKTRICGLSEQMTQMQLDPDHELVCLENDVEQYRKFTDDDIRDGSNYVLSFAVLCPTEQTIQYFVGEIWEATILTEEYKEVLVNTLGQISAE